MMYSFPSCDNDTALLKITSSRCYHLQADPRNTYISWALVLMLRLGL